MVAGRAQAIDHGEIVRVHMDRPPDTVRWHVDFEPESQPTPGEVHEIAALEQARFGGPSIIGRIACETGGLFNWNATNGQYRGLLQIGPVWSYLWAGAPRDVAVKDSRVDRRWVWKVTLFADGHKRRVRDHRKRVEVVRIREGKLPASADPYHGWAAIRVGQLAVAGGRTTSWSCGL